MFEESVLRVSIPVREMARARKFYTEKLGLKVAREDEFSVTFHASNGLISLTESKITIIGRHILLTWVVDDITSAVEQMQAAGIVLEEYNLPGVKMQGGIADFGSERVAWFKDTEGNILAVAQPMGQ
jgi:predicted enzyme related to lactoylglutathione lyase